MAGTNSVSRHPTIPLTQRDSLSITGSRVSLISTASSTNHQKLNHKDSPANRSDSAAVKKRPQKSPKKVKRTDSYKRALNRQSVYDNLDDVDIVLEPKPTTRRVEDRQKYNTLPIKPTHNISNGESNRKKRPSGDKSREGGQIQRNVSQKSGTYPSPDTDEDQNTTQPERKKKSAFKRFKERFVSSIKRDQDNQSKRKADKSQRGQQNGVKTDRVRPHDTQTMSGFHTPAEKSAKGHIQVNGHAKGESGMLTLPHNSEHMQEDKKPGFFSAIKRSFRRKQSPMLQSRSDKGSQESRLSSTDNSSSPRGGASHTVGASAPINIPKQPENTEDSFEITDPITELFGSIIDRPKADRSNLRLELRQTCRPRSFDRPDGRTHGYGYRSGDLSPTVEIDGLDYADGVSDSNPETSEELTFQEVSQGERQRRVDDVARCLAAIGDKIAADKIQESAGSSSEVEGHRVGLTDLERSIREDLLQFADRDFSFGQLSQNGVSVSVNLMPIIKNIIAAQDYSNFKHVIQQELSHTNGWDQVAWYTYLIKTTVCLAETKIGTVVRNRATKYFKSFIQPWVASRPNGWESIHEETDVDTELD